VTATGKNVDGKCEEKTFDEKTIRPRGRKKTHTLRRLFAWERRGRKNRRESHILQRERRKAEKAKS